MFDITPIINAVVMLIAAVITAVIIPHIKSRTNVDQQKHIMEWASIAAQAAEQLFFGTGQGAAKRDYVQDFLSKHGVTLDEAHVEALIESAVYQMKNKAGSD